jgi:hypothetical protein
MREEGGVEVFLKFLIVRLSRHTRRLGILSLAMGFWELLM